MGARTHMAPTSSQAVIFPTWISVTIYIIKLKLSVCNLKVLLEGSLSQILDLGPSLYFLAKKW